MVFHWSLIDSKSPQVSRTLLSIQVDLNKFGWSPVDLLFPSTNHLVTVPNIPITIGITSAFMFHSCFFLIRLGIHLSFYPLVSRNSKVGIFFFLFSFFNSFCWLLKGLAKIKLSVCISKFQRILCVSFSWTDSGLCIYHLFIWLNSNFLHYSQWITFPTQSCLVLYCFLCQSRQSISGIRITQNPS